MKQNRLLIPILLSLLVCFVGCAKPQYYKRTCLHMGTTAEFNIPLRGKGITQIKEVTNSAEAKIAELDKMLSIFDGSSAISKINQDAKKTNVEVAPELFHIVKRAKEYFALTQGAFDITVEPLTQSWGFGPEKADALASRKAAGNRGPQAGEVTNILTDIGLDKVELDEDSQTLIFKNPKTGIDFGGLAKGYAVDRAVEIFRTGGISDGIVNIGGDLYCMGTNSDNEKWSIGIRDPEDKNAVMALLKVSDKAIATSGNYENFRIHDNRRYGHIIDPRTGRPVTNNLTSVTVIADDCTTADALATAVFVLGEDRGLELIEKMPATECLLAVKRGGKTAVLASSGWKEYAESWVVKSGF